MPKLQQWLLRAGRALTSPLLPADFLELINPLWSTRETRGRISSIQQETEEAHTILIRPGWEWAGHAPGQYLRIGFDIDGVLHWRAYSLTSDPDRRDGMISITVKHVEDGVVSPFLNQTAKPGQLVRLGGVEGEFTLPDEIPEKILFITAGSGITPVMSMLRHLQGEEQLTDVVHVHSAPARDRVIFGEQLRELDEEYEGYSLTERHTEEDGEMQPSDLDDICPDWKEREMFFCGPGPMREVFMEMYEEAGIEEQVHYESFQPTVTEGEGEGGTIKFLKSDTEAESDGNTPILDAGEEAGLELDYGCRIGICHTCTGTLCSGQVRDMRSGEVHGAEGDVIRICINAPEGPVEVDL